MILKLSVHVVVNTHPKRVSMFWFVYTLEQVEEGKSGGKKLSEHQTVIFQA